MIIGTGGVATCDARDVCRTDAFIQRSDKSAEKQKQHARGILGVKAFSASGVSRALIIRKVKFCCRFVGRELQHAWRAHSRCFVVGGAIRLCSSSRGPKAC
jgi:hypothetical protein